MKIAIVDDEPRWRRLAIEAVKSYADAIKTFDSGIEFLKENREYEIVLMDIEMPGMDGFDTIIKYKEQYPESIIIVLTTHLECARRGYLVNAFRYVDKTKMKEELEEAFEKIKELNRENNYVVTGKDGDVIKNILLKDILYIEAKGRGTVINTKNECYKCDKKIYQLEMELEEFGFYKSHKSFLINLNMMESLDKEFVYFCGNKRACVSVRRYVETKKKYIATKKRFASM